MCEDGAGGGEEPQPEHEQPQQGMEQGRAWPTSGVGGDPPHRGGAAGGEQQGAAPRRRGAGAAAAVAAAGGRGVWRRVASLVTLTAIVVATLVYYSRPPRIKHPGAGTGPEAFVVTSSFTGAPDGVNKQEPVPASVTPVPSADATNADTSTSGVSPSAAARLNLTGNAKAPSGTEALLNAASASGASQVNEKLKQALEENPSLIDVVDDTRFFKDKHLSPGLECFPMDAEELEVAIEETDCVIVHLQPSDNTLDNPYRLNREINITRSLIIQGDTFDQPFIDCFDAVRCFRVKEGGYLTMRYVGINQGTGEYRDPIPFLEGTPPGMPTTPTGMVLESRGGSVLFDPGALGGLFVGCMFFDDMSGEEEVELIVELNLALVSVRIYGGFIFIGGGTLQFIGCLFYDYEVIATNDRIYLGGDILVLAGEVSFTGCVWIYSTWFAGEYGAGFNIAMIDGVSLFTFCEFTELNAFIITAGVGQAFMVIGGVQLLTGVSMSYFTIGAIFAGTGELTVFGGAQIATGVSVFDVYALNAAYGAGLDYCVGGGVLVHVGTTVNQYSGPQNSGIIGGYSFIGGGVYHATAAPVYALAATAAEFGGGSVAWVGGGIATFIACPVLDVCGIGVGYFAGEYYYVGEGFLVWLFSPIIVFAAIDRFGGFGGFLFLGLGAAVLGYSPTFQRFFITNAGRDYWVMGTCEPLPDTWAEGPPFLVTMGYAGPNSDGFRRCTNRTYPPGTFDGVRRRLQLPQQGATASVEPAGGRQIGVALFNSKREGLDLDDAGLVARLGQHGVREGTLAAGRMFAEAMAPFEAEQLERQQDRRPPPQPSLYVNSPVDGYCGVCGIEDVRGPGMDSCEYAESCDDGFKAPPGYEGLTDFNAIDYKERFVILGSMESTSRANVSSDPYLNYTAAGQPGSGGPPVTELRNADLEGALKAAVQAAFDGGLADGTEDPLHVTVWSMAPDPLFEDVYPPPKRSLAETGEGDFAATHHHGVAIITTSRADADAIITTLQAAAPPGGEGTGPGRPAPARRRRGQSEYVPVWEDEGVAAAAPDDEGGEMAPGVVASYEAGTASWGGGQKKPGAAAEAAAQQEKVTTGVKAQMKGSKGIELGHVGLTFKRALYIPPYNSKAMTQQNAAQALNLGPLTVVLQDPEMPAVPVTHVEYKQLYRVHIEQFPPHAKLHLQIVGVPETTQGLSALGMGAPLLKRTIAGSAAGLGLNQLVTDAEGRVDLEYRFRLLDAPAGDYSLVATDIATGLSGQSLLFLLSTQSRRRRLYGPAMHV